jgi:polyisoprenoid-binding protein YceI
MILKNLILSLHLLIPLLAKEIYFTRTGFVSFFSSTPVEDIQAKNNQTSCILDLETGKTSFRIPIRGFEFPNALMQEHFNENYMESEKYPNASFNGKIENWNSLEINESPQEVVITGEMSIHGVTKEIKETGIISTKSNKIFGKSTFVVKLEDYNIKIPKIVIKNIAESIKINIELDLKKK